MQPGAHQTIEYLPLLVGKQVGVVGNQSSLVIIDEKRIHLIDHLFEQGVDISKVFAPEHGFRGKDDAGALIDDEVDDLGIEEENTENIDE